MEPFNLFVTLYYFLVNLFVFCLPIKLVFKGMDSLFELKNRALIVKLRKYSSINGLYIGVVL